MSCKPLCLLDNIRLGNGCGSLKNFYRDLMKKNREKALELINDPNIRFGSLYQLRDEFSDPSAEALINPLHRKAIELAEKLSGEADRRTEADMRSGGDDTYAALKWMLETGYDEEGNGSGYDLLMERTAALLSISFRDSGILPLIVEMIYGRNKSGGLIHELVWAFFEARRPESLGLLAQKLNSADSRDVELSRKLLCFIPFLNENAALPGCTFYAGAMAWLQENVPFLYYTGESLHMSSQPLHYAVAWEAKYLCRPVSADDGEWLSILNPFESELLKQYNKLPESTRMLLADFSYRLYRSNFQQWSNWMQLPLEGQASLAGRYMGGLA